MLKGAILGFLLQTWKGGRGLAEVEKEYMSNCLPHFHFCLCCIVLEGPEMWFKLQISIKMGSNPSRTVPGREQGSKGTVESRTWNSSYRDLAGDSPWEAIFIALGRCQSQNSKQHLSSYSEVCDYLSLFHLIPALLFEFSESTLSLWAWGLGEASGIKIQQAISSLKFDRMASSSVGPFPGRVFRGAQRLMLSLSEAPSRIGREDGGRVKRETGQ